MAITRTIATGRPTPITTPTTISAATATLPPSRVSRLAPFLDLALSVAPAESESPETCEKNQYVAGVIQHHDLTQTRHHPR